MPCTQMKELAAHFHRYAERQPKTIQAASERHKETTGTHGVAQFRMAYLMQLHRKNCDVCQGKGLDSILTCPLLEVQV